VECLTSLLECCFFWFFHCFSKWSQYSQSLGVALSVALRHEKPPLDPSFVHRWHFQLGKTVIQQELVYKLSPKMYKFHEWYMWHSANGVESLGILARPEDFATEGERWSGCNSKIFMKFTIWTPWIPILSLLGVSKWHIFLCLLINLLRLWIC
jgi:hypothetical protein